MGGEPLDLTMTSNAWSPCADPQCAPPQLRSGFPVLAACVLLVLSVIVVFGQTVEQPFVNIDDPKYIKCNPHVTAACASKASSGRSPIAMPPIGIR